MYLSMFSYMFQRAEFLFTLFTAQLLLPFVGPFILEIFVMGPFMSLYIIFVLEFLVTFTATEQLMWYRVIFPILC